MSYYQIVFSRTTFFFSVKFLVLPWPIITCILMCVSTYERMLLFVFMTFAFSLPTLVLSVKFSVSSFWMVSFKLWESQAYLEAFSATLKMMKEGLSVIHTRSCKLISFPCCTVQCTTWYIVSCLSFFFFIFSLSNSCSLRTRS